jgi:1-deoxy-D-xylulose-5-phosphate reductoisomerase
MGTVMRRVAILGSTGSIGTQALDVAAHLGLEVRGLAAGSNWRALKEQIERFRPARAALADPAAGEALSKALNGSPTAVLPGPEGVRAVAAGEDVEVVLCGISGAAALGPALAAAERGKTLALANKEALVMAGPILLEAARASGARIVPVDSEHSAVFQALRAGHRREVRRVILTASGGPFARLSRAELEDVTPEQALRHPTWDMGGKITIDSATMFNKALEIVEAKWLFDLEPSQIEVVLHPQSIVHSLVEFVDGSVVAQMSVPDMRAPIQYAFTFPERAAGTVRPLDLAEVGVLTFERPDREKFPSLELGYRAAEAGGTLGAVLNAANEVAVGLFLERRIRFPQIFDVVRRVMDRHRGVARPSLEDVLQADAWARQEARWNS